MTAVIVPITVRRSREQEQKSKAGARERRLIFELKIEALLTTPRHQHHHRWKGVVSSYHRNALFRSRRQRLLTCRWSRFIFLTHLPSLIYRTSPIELINNNNSHCCSYSTPLSLFDHTQNLPRRINNKNVTTSRTCI